MSCSMLTKLEIPHTDIIKKNKATSVAIVRMFQPIYPNQSEFQQVNHILFSLFNSS